MSESTQCEHRHTVTQQRLLDIAPVIICTDCWDEATPEALPPGVLGALKDAALRGALSALADPNESS